MNAAIGVKLRHRETDELHYFHASQNNFNIFERPHLINYYLFNNSLKGYSRRYICVACEKDSKHLAGNEKQKYTLLVSNSDSRYLQ